MQVGKTSRCLSRINEHLMQFKSRLNIYLNWIDVTFECRMKGVLCIRDRSRQQRSKIKKSIDLEEADGRNNRVAIVAHQNTHQYIIPARRRRNESYPKHAVLLGRHRCVITALPKRAFILKHKATYTKNIIITCSHAYGTSL